MEAQALERAGITITEGESFSSQAENEIILGKMAISNLEQNYGGIVNINDKEYKVTGIFETGNPILDGG
jgi:putative ABC transport system permease protein